MATEDTSTPSTASSFRHTPPAITIAATRTLAAATPVPPSSLRHAPPSITTAVATPLPPPTIVSPPSGTPVDNFTVFGNANHDVKCTVNFLKKRNYSIVIRDECELNIIRARKVAKKHPEACTSRKGKEKVGELNPNVSKAALAHSVVPSSAITIPTPHQLEMSFDLSPRNLSQEFLTTNLNQQILEHAPPSKATIAQRLRRERERNERPPVQTRFFPGLPRRHRRPRRVFLDQELNESNVIEDDQLSDELQNTCDNVPVNFRSKHNPGRHLLANMNVACPYCKALHWMDEKLRNSSCGYPLFGTCCLQGKIQLPVLLTPPPELASLYDGDDDKSKSFRRYTREYNAANAFTSLGVQMDDRVLSGRGPTSFTIHGELRHRTGTLLPQSGQEASYAQLYIYDPNAALEIRSRRNLHLRRDVLEDIQKCLLQYNAFSNKFRQAFAILEQLNSTDQNIPAYIHYSPFSIADRRRYNLPTANEVAVILPGDGTQISGVRDIVVRLRGNNELMRINECHPAYLPLHYVLLFPYGELGWEPELKQWNIVDGRHTTNRLTQLQFYAYRLFERSSEYSTILRGGKLFQEFIVDAWAATEQNRLTYYKLNQPKLRRELYQGLADIAADGFEPHQVGQRIVLPSSFRGSPRHMFEIFQDSMAITRYNQHPDIFLTMTANPNWHEITSALLPHQHAIDRPDNEKPFGGITVVLGGDFRQILPVIPKGTREEIVGSTLRRSVLWNKVHVLTLNVNMRLNNTHTANADFSNFLMEIGSNPQENIKLPQTIRKCRNLNDLLCTVYPELSVVGTVTPKFLNERTILSARNDDVSTINSAALNLFPGETVTYFAADKILEDELVDRTITNRYPNEFLNSLDPSGLPPFKLNLKVGCPIMLLRNIAPKDGLCNGTRLMVVKCAHRVIEAQILTGDKCGNFVFIPRISLTPSSSELPIKMTRRQFPVRLAYAMTMNKAQGQSAQFVGVDLRTPDWDAAAKKFRYINSSSLRNWGSNEIVVHSPYLKAKYIHIDARLFFSVVKKIYTSFLKK